MIESGGAQQVVHRAGDDDLAAVLTSTRADVDHPVRGADGVLVVLDHDQGVAEVAQPHQRLDEAVVVPLVKADGRLVQHVEHPDQSRPDLCREPDPLSLSPGEGSRRAAQGEVVETDVEQEPQSLVDLLQDALGDLGLARVEIQLAQEHGALPDRHRRDVGDRPPAQRHGERDGLQPGAVAGRARHLPHEPLEALAARVALGLGVPPLDVGDDPLEARVVGPLAAVPVLVADVHLLGVTFEQGLAGPWREAAARPRPCGNRGSRRAPRPAGRSSRSCEPSSTAKVPPPRGSGPGRGPRARGRPPCGCRDREHSAQAPNGLLKENERGSSSSKRQVVVGAVEVLGELALPVRVVLGQVDEVEGDQPATEDERGLDRVGEPSLGAGLDLRAGRRPPRWCASPASSALGAR